ncbi:MAG: efflux RND transporter periplasmic adaptor subunit [Terriglobales bacterium]
MNRRYLLAAIAVVAVAGTAAVRYIRNQSSQPISTIKVSGNVEVTDVEVGFKIAGRMEQRLVDEGEIVHAGQLVGLLDATELSREIDVRQAEVQAALAELAELEAGSRPEEVAQGEAVLALANAEQEQAAADFRRTRELYEHGVVSARQFEVMATGRSVSEARVREAAERLTLLRKGPRQERIEQARARLARAKQMLALAQTQFTYASVMAPVSGVVLSKNAEAGEYVSPGTPVVTIGDLSSVWLRAYINETDLGRVKIGQPVRVTTDTYPGKIYEGRVSFISSAAEFTPKNVQTDKERVKLVYRVKVDIPNPDMELKPGMPADAEILLGQAHAEPRPLPAPTNLNQTASARSR